MASILTIAELRKMQSEDLLRELCEQAAIVAKLRLGIKMNKEKDTGKYRREKKQLSRMQTVITENTKKSQRIESSASSVPSVSS
ncbi:MAG: 50S ribosomal protein L29 [Patescibacteria group bacterium]